ncbi:MAG: DNA polymerase/3'-5' exonuclease PolX [Candidatus Acidulodesulfobacterium ferriphilum]|jgi:DNA polymerase IV (family X)|uniref:DNA-directed DNA polymerase n=1 Tax=Candidatus Acidulodesulfobacterium ferriphilum TaxID=2597223 RepID=A0A519BCB0_9DELT|nr:MAG: DNA polymerase/3'-5' exonuclease PolX [Candidatus Acidulodesulfobacterium ferriphilum]
MTNSEIARVFEQIAEILEIKGENPFKIRAYLNASRVINQLGESLSDIAGENGLINIPGIGKDLSLKIKELIKTGHLAYYDELAGSIPQGVLELIKLRGLGPKKANMLYENFHIKSIDGLYNAILSNKLTKMHGFGEKTIENLKESIEEYRTFSQRFLYVFAQEEASAFVDYLKNTPYKLAGVIAIAGSLRRKMETVGDIDIVASVKEKDKQVFTERFVNYDKVLRIESTGETKISVILKSGIHVDLRIVQDEDFVYALHHFTGSKLHNEELRTLVKKDGYKINEYGIFRDRGIDNASNKVKVANEIEFYNVFGMQFIPPELREGTGEIDAALSRGIPELVEEKDLQGIFHVHTTYTDGKDSLEDMVKASLKNGYKYVGISDHSVSAHYANGLDRSNLGSQIEYIDRLNDKYKGKIKIFKGIESDILADGGLDYDDETLSMLDFVIASVHSKFNMPEAQMTERIINAVKNPYTTMIGHLTGRLLLERKGYAVNVSKVLDYASKYRTIIELNANPKRLDIDWRHIKEAVSKSVLIAINPDAHNVSSIYFAGYGVNAARKGWAKKADILNTRSASEVMNIFKDIRDYKLKLR